jgi:hypothetical protein
MVKRALVNLMDAGDVVELFGLDSKIRIRPIKRWRSVHSTPYLVVAIGNPVEEPPVASASLEKRRIMSLAVTKPFLDAVVCQ